MDPVTQGVLGAAAAQAIFGRKLSKAWLVGAAAGLAPDLDILIKSSEDPLLGIEYHRHFTHALAFIPLGGLICALPFFLRKRYRDQWRKTLAASITGYATHGVLDACTTYGTLLLWPFSNVRIAWDWISIIDPMFTIPLLVGVFLAALWGNRRPAAIALIIAAGYMAMGAFQRHRAAEVQQAIAEHRGHKVERGEVFPTFANQWVWRSLYESGGRFYADRIRAPWFGKTQWKPGDSVDAITLEALPIDERANPRVVADFKRFSWFSDGWVAHPHGESRIYGDVRYSLRTDTFEPIWGIRFDVHADVPTSWVSRTTDRDLGLKVLWGEILGEGEGYVDTRAE